MQVNTILARDPQIQMWVCLFFFPLQSEHVWWPQISIIFSSWKFQVDEHPRTLFAECSQLATLNKRKLHLLAAFALQMQEIHEVEVCGYVCVCLFTYMITCCSLVIQITALPWLVTGQRLYINKYILLQSLRSKTCQAWFVLAWLDLCFSLFS